MTDHRAEALRPIDENDWRTNRYWRADLAETDFRSEAIRILLDPPERHTEMDILEAIVYAVLDLADAVRESTDSQKA